MKVETPVSTSLRWRASRKRAYETSLCHPHIRWERERDRKAPVGRSFIFPREQTGRRRRGRRSSSSDSQEGSLIHSCCSARSVYTPGLSLACMHTLWKSPSLSRSPLRSIPPYIKSTYRDIPWHLWRVWNFFLLRSGASPVTRVFNLSESIIDLSTYLWLSTDLQSLSASLVHVYWSPSLSPVLSFLVFPPFTSVSLSLFLSPTLPKALHRYSLTSIRSSRYSMESTQGWE